MKLPLEIFFEGLERSEAIEAAVKKHAAKLDRYYGELMRCSVRIVCDEKHKHQGKPFAVRIDLTMPGHEIVSNREAHEDVYVALRDAFDATSRQLEDVVRKLRGQVKTHAEPLHGIVVSVNREHRFGFIRTAAEEDFYFGPDNLADLDFGEVAVGTHVHFIGEVAGEGRQAKRVCKDAR
ncbi:HPF/RaiA family ribosome-associated protein [Trinickia dabaoshanensis]|nr:HPF/RaiA family ribosome-associated protein [Trinickia dabaoshanensis]